VQISNLKFEEAAFLFRETNKLKPPSYCT